MNLKKAIKSFNEFNKTDYVSSIAINLLFVIISLSAFGNLLHLCIESGYNENPEFAGTFLIIGVACAVIAFVFIHFIIDTIKLIVKCIKEHKAKQVGEK